MGSRQTVCSHLQLICGEGVLPFPVDSGCSGTFTPAMFYPEKLGVSPLLLQPPLSRRIDTMKPGLFGGLYWGRKNHSVHGENSSLILTQFCESKVVETNLCRRELKIQ